MTLADIVAQAYVDNGILAPGDTVPAEHGARALVKANLLLEENNISPSRIWTTVIQTFDLTARTLPTYWYTIGPSGADFTAQRPIEIKRANIVLNSSSPTSRFPLQILDDMQWSDVSSPDQGTAPYPSKLYLDGDYPNSKLYLWPYPTSSGNQLEIFTDKQVAAFVALTDTFAFPPGYANAFELTLSEWLCEGFKDIPASLQKAAAKARSRFSLRNNKPPKMSTTDSGMPRQGRGGDGTFWSGWQNNGR